ncbi:MAG: NAD(P)/FAD-dependent oxidoreductase [Kineosporiaceae bacterium]
MSRSPLTTALRAACGRLAAEDAAHDAQRRRTPEGPSRRGVLRAGLLVGAAGAAGSALAADPATAARAGAAAQPRVLVVGAGLAGLCAADVLKRNGITATVVEAADRVGGRCWTLRGYFADGQIAERGGELIDTGHTAIRQLVQDLRLDTDNLLAAEPQGSLPLYWFDGAPYTYDQATNDLKAIWQQLKSDVQAASYPTTYKVSTPRGRELDRMSILEWIDLYVPGGRSSKLGQLLDVAYAIEYGADCGKQSSLNMLYLLGYSGPGQLRIFGPSNEKFHVRGGNDQIVSALAARLTGQIKLGTRLVALARGAGTTWQVTTSSGSRSTTATYDHVVLALPFSLLRDVDLSKAGFTGVKATAIAQSKMGANTKLQLQFRSRHWNALGGTGDTYADTGYQSTWEVSRAQSGASGILVDYTGGTPALGFKGATPAALAQRFLGQIEPVLPGLSAQWNGRVSLDDWSAYPWTKGAYSYWGVGDYTAFSGAEGEPVGTCFFAGEHTSQDFQGYLNGAVETGQRAAAQVLATLK